MQKRIFTLFAMSLLLAATFAIQAQNTHTFGDYDADGTCPINVGYNYSASQMIFTPEQVGVVGNIYRIIFNNTGGGGYDRSVRVYVGTTTKTHFTGVDDWIDPSDLTCVYYGEERISSYSFDITPDIPFYYDGTSNLVIYIYDQTGSYQSGNSRAYFETDIDDSRDYVTLKYSSDTYPISFPSPNANFCEISKELPVVDFYKNNDPIPTTMTYGLPTATTWDYSLSQQIFTPEEINGIGNIDSIVIHGLNSAVTSRNKVEIYLCHTDQIDFNGNPRSGSTWYQTDSMTRVFSDTLNFTGDPDLTIHFDTTFEYDGHSNLVLAVCDKSGSGSVSVQATCNAVPTYRSMLALSHSYFPISFAYPNNSERFYIRPFINSIQFFEPNCGISVDGNIIADRYADNFTQGLESGNIVYEADTKTLTLNNITLVNQDDPEINCSKHVGDLTIVSNGFNSNSRGKFIAAPGYKTTFQGDVFNLGCIEVSDSGSEVVFDNTKMIINVNNDGLNYGLHGCGNETLTINNSDVKVYGNISAVDGFAGITLNDCEITYPAGAVVDGGRITLNGLAVSDTVIIIPTKAAVENVTSTEFSIFPNPAETEVTLHLMPFEGTAHMSIYSADGRIMNVAELPAIDSDYRMDVSSLPAGIYNITVTSNSLRQTATLIKK